MSWWKLLSLINVASLCWTTCVAIIVRSSTRMLACHGGYWLTLWQQRCHMTCSSSLFILMCISECLQFFCGLSKHLNCYNLYSIWPFCLPPSCCCLIVSANYGVLQIYWCSCDRICWSPHQNLLEVCHASRTALCLSPNESTLYRIWSFPETRPPTI